MYSLVADSGSTKTIWHLLRAGQSLQQVQGQGINPYYLDDSSLRSSLQEALAPFPLAEIQRLHFFGAGCDSDAQRQRLQRYFQAVCPQAQIEITSDLWAAIRATAGSAAGIVSILGTGSNSCEFDGQSITAQTPPLGFVLGDEGSGGDLGRRLLQAYFYKELPQPLRAALKQQGYSRTKVLKAVYEQAYPNRYVAQFVPFIKAHIEDVFLQKLVDSAFSTFIQRHLSSYPHFRDYPLYFVGSVAYHFQHRLKKCVAQEGLQVGQILKAPFPQLLKQY